MRKTADSISFPGLPFLVVLLAVVGMSGCFYPGYYDAPYYHPYDNSISFYPPAIDFFYSDRQSSFSYSGYPFYFTHYPYQYPRYDYYPYYRFHY